MDAVDQEPYPDVVVRRRLRRGSVRTYLSPATVRGEEWLAAECPERSGNGSCEVLAADVPSWVKLMRAGGLVVLVGDGA